MAKGSKGAGMEESLKAYFWKAGYFAVRGLPYQLDGEDITDIDLWLYERPAAATRRRIIVDAKNKKSPKAAERLIWTRGLHATLGVDSAIVATTDKRASIKRFGKALGLQVLDGEAVSKIAQSDRLETNEHLSLDELDDLIRDVDTQRRSNDWRTNIHDARGSLITGMGVPSANKNLAVSAFFAEQAIMAQPGSTQAVVGLRLFYLTSAFAAVSLDFVLADQAFRSVEERRSIIINAIRFGQADTAVNIPVVKAAINLSRKYVDNGQAVAKQIERGFFEEASSVSAEFIADYLSKISRSDSLFNIAREIERASCAIQIIGYDGLSAEARSLLGVFLDFNGISREKLALSVPMKAKGPQQNLGLFGENPTN